MARVLRKTGLTCPNCGSTNVLREKPVPLGFQLNAECKSCGFEIFKSNLQVGLDALIVLVIFGTVAWLNFGDFSLSRVQLGAVILFLFLLLGSFSLTAKIPDSAAVKESALHKVASRIVSASQWLGVGFVSYYFVTM